MQALRRLFSRPPLDPGILPLSPLSSFLIPLFCYLFPVAKRIHPVRLEVYRHLLTAVPEEMGTVLRRTAYSSNVRERRDYSCALFDSKAQLVAMGDHMPVHLGSMPMSVKAALAHEKTLQPGDVVILNDPFAGGTHLPDLTMVAPVFEPSDGFARPVFYVAVRAHHADVGGMSPGSMPLSRDVFQEGIRIPPTKLYRQGRLNVDLLRLLLSNVRTPLEREGDLAAQVGSLRVGDKRLRALVEKNGRPEVEKYCRALQDYSAKIMRQTIRRIPNGRYTAEDLLDDAGPGEGSEPVPIRVGIRVTGNSMKIDFAGSAPQMPGCLNAVRAVTRSAVYYVLRCLAPDDAPASAGLMRSVRVMTPQGSVVDARFPAATAGGNVETSQRIVDVLLRALAKALPDQIPAASSGTMNNISIGGIHPGTGEPFSYYETIGGGMGAGPAGPGTSGVHTHMTNSLNTPIEALEYDFPLRVREYRLRTGSGAKGRNRGGDGIVRTLEVLTGCTATILSERRVNPPYGLNGGDAGKKGRNYLVDRGRRKNLAGKVSLQLTAGQAVRIETPGGGGWGGKETRKKESGKKKE